MFAFAPGPWLPSLPSSEGRGSLRRVVLNAVGTSGSLCILGDCLIEVDNVLITGCKITP